MIDKHPPETARCSVDATSSVIKRPRGRPRMYRLSAEETGDARPAELTGAARFTEAGDARPAELTGGAASTGIKRGRGRPRKDKTAAAAMPADAGSAGIKRGRGRPRKEKKPAAAMLAETEAGDTVSTGMKGALENPISGNVVSTGTNGALLRTENPAAGDFVSMVMKRGPCFD